MVDKKQLYIIIAVVVIVIGVFIAIKFWPSKGYSNNPKDWIENGNVDVRKATKSLSYQDFTGQQYNSGNVETVFIHDGIYLGNGFKDEYVKGKEVLIRFTKDILPSNNIPEIFMMERIENNKPIAYIFLDDDWKSQIRNTNIVWGRTYQNSKLFEFNEIENGIYYDSVEDDINRFSDDFKIHYGGVMVGQVTKEDIDDKLYENIIAVRLK